MLCKKSFILPGSIMQEVHLSWVLKNERDLYPWGLIASERQEIANEYTEEDTLRINVLTKYANPNECRPSQM